MMWMPSNKSTKGELTHKKRDTIGQKMKIIKKIKK